MDSTADLRSGGIFAALAFGVAFTPAVTFAQSPPPPTAAPPPAAAALTLQSINNASFTPLPPPVAGEESPSPMIVKAEVLLDRDRFSPGVIDGKRGENMQHAVAAFQTSAGIKPSGEIDQATWATLTRNAAPVAANYTITPKDVGGPFAPDVGEDFIKLAALPQGPLYSTPLEMLAERFHMSQDLLKTLNPTADFGKAGTVILVAQPGVENLPKGSVKRIEVSKAHAQVVAYGAGHKVLAVYPATVGSTERPSPSGTHKINGVAWNTNYTYDPSKLHWGPRSHGKLVIKPGPNGPVGVVWIDINAPSYGIHGTPDPSKIGKTASHGCVRLANWDAVALARGVRPGVVVDFVGTRGG